MDILNIVQLLVKCDSLIVKRNQKKPQKPKSHSHCPVTNLARCQNIILLCQGKGRSLLWSLSPVVPPSCHSWSIRGGPGLASSLQVFCGPSVTRWAWISWLPRAVTSSGLCHQHHSCLGTASVAGINPHCEMLDLLLELLNEDPTPL